VGLGRQTCGSTVTVIEPAPIPAAVDASLAADPVDSVYDLRRDHVGNRQDGTGLGARDAGPTRAGGLVELIPAARRLAAALAILIIGVHLVTAMPAYGQAGLDPAGIQACTSAATLISDLRIRSVSTAQARQRLTAIYNMAQTSRAASIRQIASMQSGQIASADDTQLLVMAEQFVDVACR
jgi:hypothetical protein